MKCGLNRPRKGEQDAKYPFSIVRRIYLRSILGTRDSPCNRGISEWLVTLPVPNAVTDLLFLEGGGSYENEDISSIYGAGSVNSVLPTS